jgi:hypothetical protein
MKPHSSHEHARASSPSSSAWRVEWPSRSIDRRHRAAQKLRSLGGRDEEAWFGLCLWYRRDRGYAAVVEKTTEQMIVEAAAENETAA